MHQEQGGVSLEENREAKKELRNCGGRSQREQGLLRVKDEGELLDLEAVELLHEEEDGEGNEELPAD